MSSPNDEDWTAIGSILGRCELLKISTDSELLSLLCPVNWEVGHLGDTEAARQSAINRSLHDVRGKEGE